MDQCSFAYSLSQVENGWRWSVYDENGEVVADGAHSNRAAAQDAVEAALSGVGAERSA
jgi:hypothetical protein